MIYMDVMKSDIRFVVWRSRTILVNMNQRVQEIVIIIRLHIKDFLFYVVSGSTLGTLVYNLRNN